MWRYSKNVVRVSHHKRKSWVKLFGKPYPKFILYEPTCGMSHIMERHSERRPLFHSKSKQYYYFKQSSRGMSMVLVRILRGALKIRYLVLGGAMAGGMSLQKTYEEWMNAIPDLSWMDSYISNISPQLKGSIVSIAEKLRELEIDPQLRHAASDQVQYMKTWFEKRLEEASIAAEQQKDDSLHNAVTNSALIRAEAAGANRKEKEAEDKRFTISEEDLWEIQTKYQKELERLERENKDLRKQNILLRRKSNLPTKAAKLSLIDMYSEVLDELNVFDESYDIQDHLPRVVVIGDQSSGKTSVLEMIAQARIFPRGAGEMMTRSPVKVTLSEGPYHIAQFKDSNREFDLTQESDLVELRREVELRMRNAVKNSKTVSHDVISMTVKGPGIQRMVLVDLPGIISTTTQGMAADTKDEIYSMIKYYISNPNAIILCIQDGSVDAERSNVTELVAQMDPQGKRTIFVLTKVDMVEDNLANPERVKKILSGQLFPMKALGYFAVVTGQGTKGESIQKIREYEEQFFRSSKLFSGKNLKSSQMTSRNLSLAVSECFWKMVKETVKQQADAFKAQRFNLEKEWRNKFPKHRMLDRNELFDRARSVILDEVVNLMEVPTEQWEQLIYNNLWDKVYDYLFENIYMPACKATDADDFLTKVDIRLCNWAEEALPRMAVEAGWEALEHEFRKLVEKSKQREDHDEVFSSLEHAVVDEALSRHTWEPRALTVLRVIQLQAFEDQAITDKQEWDNAVKFLESSIRKKLKEVNNELTTLFGPSTIEQWLYWKYVSDDCKDRKNVRRELENILTSNPDHSFSLTDDELKVVRSTLQRDNLSCGNDEYILKIWQPVYENHFLNRTLERLPHFRSGFYFYRQGVDHLEYNEVILFWRIQQMMKVTVNAIRQQIMNREATHLDDEIKEVLDEFAKNQSKKEELLTGRRVTLAEELKKVKHIQEKLEEFIKALNDEKSR